MQRKFYLPLNLQLFADELAVDTGVEVASDAGMQQQGEIPSDPAQSQADANTGAESPAAGDKQNNYEKAFAKRMAAERAQWDAERTKLTEQYQGYDQHKRASEYLLRNAGLGSMDELLAKIEQQELTARAEERGVPLEFQKEYEEMKGIKSEWQQMKETQQQQQQYQAFRAELDKFAAEKGVEPDKLYDYMAENQIGNKEAALKALKFEEAEAARFDAEQAVEQAKKEGQKELIAAKASIPKTVQSQNKGTPAIAKPKTLNDAYQRAMARLSSE